MRGFEPETKVFVAHFDILGMSSVLLKSNSAAWGLLCSLAEAKEKTYLSPTPALRENIREKFFSDTIIMHTKDDGSDSLRAIVYRSFELFKSAFLENIPLRGGIAHGSWIETAPSDRQSLFTGDALLCAYHIGEMQQLISIAVCDVTRKRIMKEYPSSFPSLIRDYPIPVKGGGHEIRAVLNWPMFCQDDLTRLGLLTAETLADYFSEFGHYLELDQRERTKYENTVAFIQSVR